MLRGFRKDMFKLKNGPTEFWFCDTTCSSKFVMYRHVQGISHILKMDNSDRKAYLEGEAIDDYISKMNLEDAVTGSR